MQDESFREYQSALQVWCDTHTHSHTHEFQRAVRMKRSKWSCGARVCIISLTSTLSPATTANWIIHLTKGRHELCSQHNVTNVRQFNVENNFQLLQIWYWMWHFYLVSSASNMFTTHWGPIFTWTLLATFRNNYSLKKWHVTNVKFWSTKTEIIFSYKILILQ